MHAGAKQTAVTTLRNGSTIPDTSINPGACDWLALIDQLYQLIESEPADPLTDMLRSPCLADWPSIWRTLVRQVEEHAQVWILKTSDSHAERHEMLLQIRLREQSTSFIARDRSRQPLSTFQAACVRDFFQHLQQGIDISHQLLQQQQAIEAMYECLEHAGLALAILDEHLNLVVLNQRCRTLLQEHPALQIRERSLRYLDRGTDPLLGAMQTFMLDIERQCVRIQLGTLEFQLNRLDATHNDLPEQPNCWLDPEVSTLPTRFHLLVTILETRPVLCQSTLSELSHELRQSLAVRYGLSEKESLLALNICRGLSLKQVAYLTGRSLETVRVQLKSIYRKLRVADQKGLCQHIFEHVQMLELAGLADWTQFEAIRSKTDPIGMPPV